MSAPEESKDTTEAAPAEKIEIDEVSTTVLQKNYDFSGFFCLLIVIIKFNFDINSLYLQ